MKRLFVLVAALAFAGCGLTDPFAKQQHIDRAKLGETALAGEQPAPPVPQAIETPGKPTPPPIEPVVKGSYSFTVPTTVSEMKHSTEKFEQYALYMGQPAPADRPFIVITVGNAVAPLATNPAGNYTIESTRNYVLNGLIASETTGFTKDNHYPFSEIIVTRPGGGDKLHAITIVPDNATRDVALGILGSISWQAIK